MVDCVDPDNIAAVVLHCLLSQAEGEDETHVVLVGRPCSFALARFSPSKNSLKVPLNESQEEERKMTFSPNFLIENASEKKYHNPAHSRILVAVCAAAFAQILAESGVKNVDKRVKFYFGGVARQAGVSHSIHEYEDLSFYVDQGHIRVRTPAEYLSLVEKVYDMKPQERVQFRINHAKHFRSIPLLDLQQLVAPLAAALSVKLVVGGPFTPLATLAKESSLRNKSGVMHAMACSWKGDKNLLGDNFNIQVDWDAFREVMIADAFPQLEKHILPTETCKEGSWIKMSQQHFDRLRWSGVAQLVHLWTSLKRGDVQPTFDLGCALPDEMLPFERKPVTLAVAENPKSVSGFRCEMSIQSSAHPTKFSAYVDTPSNPNATPDQIVDWVLGQVSGEKM